MRWRQRLEASGESLEIHPSLLWGVAVPMLHWLKQRLANGSPGRPPVLALNGPVGSGKTSLTRVLARLAAMDGVPLAVASIDDVYLTWPERRRVLQGNPFGVWRVPPGSHDIPLLLSQLDRWRRLGVLRLPRFDKTLAQGQGDRGGWSETPAAAVVIEGWLMGCRSLGPTVLEEKIAAGEGLAELTAAERSMVAPLGQGIGGLSDPLASLRRSVGAAAGTVVVAETLAIPGGGPSTAPWWWVAPRP